MQNSKIEWTDNTFNPWWGCMKVSPGCKNCYAETLDNRWKGGHWGPNSTRKPMSDKYWSQPLKWNEAAKKAGKQAKVFCASMADVFEGHPDTLPHLARLFDLIERTPWLIWQLLTKRPENILPLIKANKPFWYGELPFDGFPDNLWIGTSVENQETANERIPILMTIPSIVRFVSAEPLLGPIDFNLKVSSGEGLPQKTVRALVGGEYCIETCYTYTTNNYIHWVIVGGESGPNARPMHPDWVRSIRDQCKVSGKPFFFKQWGEWMPYIPLGHGVKADDGSGRVWHHTRENSNKFKREGGNLFYKMGKTEAGRLLDGVEYNEFPK